MMKQRCLIIPALFLVLANSVFAATLSQYRENVVNARSYISGLEAYVDSSAEHYDADRVLRIVKAVKVELPARIKVDHPGGAVEASNEWLHADLDAFLEEPEANKRAELMAGSAERLDAITQRLDEMAAAPAAGRSKDEDKQKLAEILRRKEFQRTKAAEESLIQRLFRELLDWIASMFPRSQAKQPDLSGMPNLAYFLQIILYIIIAVLIMFGLFKLAPAIFPKMRRKRPLKRKDRIILGERILDDTTSGDLFAEAEALAAKGDLRGAIRKSYIAVICELSDKRLIALARYKTNRDYLRELRRRRELQEQMGGVTGEFERRWYGAQTASAEDWTLFRENCERAMRIARAES